MNDQLKASDPEEIITCPYESVHQVTRKRMATHLEKCRKSFWETARVMVTCPYNHVHKVPKPEIHIHKDICPNRETFYSFAYNVGEPTENVQNVIRNAEVEISKIDSSESWDVDEENVFTGIEQTAEQRNVLRLHQNLPPSERKAKREEDRLKLLERQNKEQQAKEYQKNRASFATASTFLVAPSTSTAKENQKNPTSSAAASTSSVAASTSSRPSASNIPRSSEKSVLSDSQFTAALDEASSKMSGFQIVTNRGRGRAMKAQTVGPSNALAGVGRGRKLNN